MGIITSTLKEVCILVTDGTHDTPKIIPKGYPLIKAKEISYGGLNFENCDHISEGDHLEVIARSKPEYGDTLFAHIGASLGEAAYVNTHREFSIKNVALFKPDPKKIDGRYLYYLVRSPYFQGMAKAARTGSAQPFLGLAQLRNHEIHFHEHISEQENIAEILSAYDDLIENNQRRLRILEDMAQSLYREWFVHFRFPGHEKIKLINSSLGLIPQGWTVEPASEVLDINPSLQYERGSKKPRVGMEHLSTCSMLIEGWEEKIGDSGSKFQNGDTLFARITPCLENGKTGFVQFLNSSQDVATGSTEFIVLRGKKVSPEMVYLLARTNEFRDHAIKSMTGASGRQRVKCECFSSFFLAVPPANVRNIFSDWVRSHFKTIHSLWRINKNLAVQRDILLPKLISGEIDLAAASELEEAA